MNVYLGLTKEMKVGLKLVEGLGFSLNMEVLASMKLKLRRGLK